MKRVILVVCGVIVLLFSLPLLVGGAVFTAIGSGDSPTVGGRIGQVDSSGYAVVSDTLDVDWRFPFADRFDITVGVRSASPEVPVFIGYGPAASVDAYLSGVAQTLVYSVGDATRADREVEVPGTRVPEPPQDQGFWVEQASGTALQEIPLASQTGSYRLVVMNADASRGVSVDVHGSMTLPFLLPVGIGMLVLGLLLLPLGVVLLVWGFRSKPTPAATPVGYAPGYAYEQPTPPVPQQYPGGTGQYGPPAQYPGVAPTTPPVPPAQSGPPTGADSPSQQAAHGQPARPGDSPPG